MTLREHLEAIRDRGDRWCFECGYAEEHAIAALALLDEAALRYPHTLAITPLNAYRLLPDPQNAA